MLCFIIFKNLKTFFVLFHSILIWLSQSFFFVFHIKNDYYYQSSFFQYVYYRFFLFFFVGCLLPDPVYCCSKKSVYILFFTYSFIHIWWLKNFGFSLSFSTLFPITVVCLFLLFRFSSLFIQKQVNTKLIFWERIKQWSGLFSSVRYVKLINWHEWYPYDDDDDDRRSELFPKDDIAEFFSACSYYYYYYYLFHTWIIYNIYLSIYYLAVLLYSIYIHRYCFIINTIELARHNNNNNISFYFADRYRFNLVMNFFSPNRQHSTDFIR